MIWKVAEWSFSGRRFCIPQWFYVSLVAGMVQILFLKLISLQRQGGIVIFYRRRGAPFQMQRRIIFSQSLLNGVTHDVAELLPGTGRDFEKAFLLNNLRQGREILRFQRGDGQMTIAGKIRFSMLARICAA
ncbi:Uncharacterised protein [Salmonella enterica subsp. indica]|uniref:Uncharacterized protein n=2 Tax=Salmonella enterica subsp. indica TaxID=59207 RepID=A0A379XQ57_SALER|nr:Uncharacterised protein [Salmonella enterica subsp. indica]